MTITTQNLIQALRSKDLLLSTEYAFPTLTLNICSKKFKSEDLDYNINVVSDITGLNLNSLLAAINRPLINLQFYRSKEEAESPVENISDSWLSLFAESYLRENHIYSAQITDDEARAIHFYGYKGGQARTTTLAITAKRLADRGLRVLVVDADIEAPSLHVLFGSAIPKLSSSLMGLCERIGDIDPITAYFGQNGGVVELIGCRPSSKDFDIDFMAFALNTALDPSVLRHAFLKLRQLSKNSKWDVVLIDHRTGVAPSVLPTMKAWPGSVVFSLRPDTLSLPATQIAKIIFSFYPPFPGAFMSFSIDPEARREQSVSREGHVRETFLNILAEAIEAGAEDSENISPDVLERSFIPWYFDRAMLESELPDYSRLSKDNQDSISDLIQVLGLDVLKKKISDISIPDAFKKKTQQRSPSGAADSGWFIETKDISTLMQPSSSISYVFGRKGTGKTRIYREMQARGFGTPLFAAADYMGGGLRSQSVVANVLLEHCKSHFESFWRELFFAAILVNCDPLKIESKLHSRISNSALRYDDPSEILNLYSSVSSMRTSNTFLIDGVETAVGSKHTKEFVEALFRFLSTVQNDSSLSEKIRFKLFIRPDLSVGIQNVEQQVAGRKIELRWDEAAIFNYMLAEIERSEWFNINFPEACNVISMNKNLVKEARLERDQYEEIMHMIFPLKIRRNNLLTMTFLRTYFSDSVSESDKRSSFYPRIIGSFLEHVTKICSKSPKDALGNDGRISHVVILDAFEHATQEFIDEIKQELYFALNLSTDQESNQLLVDEFIVSLAGMQTPFVLDECIEKLQAKLGSKIREAKAVRDALRQMKDMGIFEIHPSDARKWRVGRLFKEALRMKYVR